MHILFLGYKCVRVAVLKFHEDEKTKSGIRRRRNLKLHFEMLNLIENSYTNTMPFLFKVVTLWCQTHEISDSLPRNES